MRELEDDGSPAGAQHAAHLAQTRIEVAKIPDGKPATTRSNDASAKGRPCASATRASKRGPSARDAARARASSSMRSETSMPMTREVRRRRSEQVEREIRRCRRDVQSDLALAKARETDGAPSPPDVATERQHAIEEVITRCDPVEHRRHLARLRAVITSERVTGLHANVTASAPAFIYAHPDDESFGIAGTAMKLASEGTSQRMLTLTRGDKGRWFGKELGSWSPQDLAAERTREWQAATKLIGSGMRASSSGPTAGWPHRRSIA
jgi:LmbE family N-acetylglucosaminyl deacetylase